MYHFATLTRRSKIDLLHNHPPCTGGTSVIPAYTGMTLSRNLAIAAWMRLPGCQNIS